MSEERYKRNKETIIEEVASWKVEYEDGEMTDEELSEFVEQLKSLGPKDLHAWWFETVGEWVASRGYDPDDCFQMLLHDEERPYGFIQWVEVRLDD